MFKNTTQKDYWGCFYDSNYGNVVVLYMKLCVTDYKCIGIVCMCADVYKSAAITEVIEAVDTSQIFWSICTFQYTDLSKDMPGNCDVLICCQQQV